ncbi:11943_t:CDS:1, partial [Ambispora leptoticha]
TIDLGADFSTMAEEFAKHLGWKINDDNHESQNINNVVSSIVRQVS